MRSCARLVALLILSLASSALAFTNPPRAATKYGSFIGTNAYNSSMWLGVPFAAPPIGPLRWRAPQPPSYSIVRQANAFGPPCPQAGPFGISAWNTSEDCLYLNIYAPMDATSNSHLPVKFWIHGGGFGGGSGMQFNGSSLASMTNSVVVTINYRLGIFGFYALTGLLEESRTLNYGLQDQTFSLKWVQDNIEGFGGDPNNITIFGESAGGCSVHLHLWMPMSHGLFHRAIMESAGPWFFYTTAELIFTNHLFLPTACNTTVNPSHILACMRNLSTADILKVEAIVIPAIDNKQILNQPLALWAENKRPPNMVPLIVGTNSYEGNLFSYVFIAPTTSYTQPFYDSVWANQMRVYVPPTANTTLVKSFYDTIAATEGYFAALSAAFGDMWINCGSFAVASAASSLESPDEPVFRYLFEHATADWYYSALNATHGAEIPYVWHVDNWALADLSPSEWNLSQQMVSLWDSFARTNNPGSIWPQYSIGSTSPFILGLQTSDVAPVPDPAFVAGCNYWVYIFTQPT